MTYPNWTGTPEEADELDAAVQKSECCCGQIERVQDHRAGIDASRVKRCAMHDALANDPKLANRLLSYRRYASRLLVQEFQPAEYLREGNG